MHAWFIIQVLLPLLNVPMLDYVMEFLVSSGVQEVEGVSCACMRFFVCRIAV